MFIVSTPILVLPTSSLSFARDNSLTSCRLVTWPMGDDSNQVWRVGGDWGVETTLMTPFDGCEDTLVRRISWSPDGQCLVATNSKDRVST